MAIDPAQLEHFSTPGIAPGAVPYQGSPGDLLGEYWHNVWHDITHPFAPIAGAGAMAGAAAGGGSASDALQAGRAAENAPFAAPVSVVKAAVGFGPVPAWASWAENAGLWVGLFALLLLAGWALLGGGK